jgi:hypothetical protein
MTTNNEWYPLGEGLSAFLSCPLCPQRPPVPQPVQEPVVEEVKAPEPEPPAEETIEEPDLAVDDGPQDLVSRLRSATAASQAAESAAQPTPEVDIGGVRSAPCMSDVGSFTLGSVRDSLNLFSAAFPTQLAPLSDDPRVATATCFSSSGALLAAVCNDGHVLVLDWDTRDLVLTLSAHTMTALAVAFSADASRIVTTGADMGVRVWNVKDGEKVWETSVNVLPIAVSFAPSSNDVILLVHTLGAPQLMNIKTGAVCKLTQQLQTSDQRGVNTLHSWYATELKTARLRPTVPEPVPETAAEPVQGAEPVEGEGEHVPETPAADREEGKEVSETHKQEPEASDAPMNESPAVPNDVVEEEQHQVEPTSETSFKTGEKAPLPEGDLPPLKRQRTEEEGGEEGNDTPAVNEEDGEAASNASEGEDGSQAEGGDEEAGDEEGGEEGTPVKRQRGRRRNKQKRPPREAGVPFPSPASDLDSATQAVWVRNGATILVGTGRGTLLFFTVHDIDALDVTFSTLVEFPSKAGIAQLFVANASSAILNATADVSLCLPLLFITTYARQLSVYRLLADGVQLEQEIFDVPDHMWRCASVVKDGSFLYVGDRGRQRPKVHCWQGFISHSTTSPGEAQVTYRRLKSSGAHLKFAATTGIAPAIMTIVVHPKEPTVVVADRAGVMQVWRQLPASTWTMYAPQLHTPEMWYNTSLKTRYDPSKPEAALPPLPTRFTFGDDDPMDTAVHVLNEGGVSSAGATAAAAAAVIRADKPSQWLRFDGLIPAGLHCTYARSMPKDLMSAYGIDNTSGLQRGEQAAFLSSTAFVHSDAVLDGGNGFGVEADPNVNPSSAVPIVDATGNPFVATSEEEAAKAVVYSLFSEGVKSVVHITARDMPIQWLPEPSELRNPVIEQQRMHAGAEDEEVS